MTDWREDRIGAALRGENPTVLQRLPGGFAVIGDVQWLPGYCVLLTDDPAVQRLSDLSRPDRAAFLESMARLGEAVERACGEQPSGALERPGAPARPPARRPAGGDRQAPAGGVRTGQRMRLTPGTLLISTQARANDTATLTTASTSALTSAGTGTGRSATATPISTGVCRKNAA